MITFATRLRRRSAFAAAAPVALVLCAGSVTRAAAAGNLCIAMADSNGQVAGIQVDLKWDSACMSPNQGSGGMAQCTADPATGKQVRASVRPGPTLKAILFSMTDTNPFGDGSLFCCSFTRSSSAGSACCGLTMGNILGSDSTGKAIAANDFTLVATMDGQTCAASQAGSGGQQRPVAGGLQGGGGGVVAPPAVSGGAPAPVPQAPVAGAGATTAGGTTGGGAAKAAAPVVGVAPVVPGAGGVPAGSGAGAPAPEAPAGMDQVQRALEQFRGAATAPTEATAPRAIATPERTRAAGTPTAKTRATEAHGTPTAAAEKTPEANKTPQATPQGTPEATPLATPKAKPRHHKHKEN